MAHKVAVISSFALAIVAAFMIATQWSTLITRGSPATTSVEAEGAATTGSAPDQIDLTQSAPDSVTDGGPTSLATEPAGSSIYSDDEDDDDSFQDDDEDDDYESEDD